MRTVSATITRDTLDFLRKTGQPRLAADLASRGFTAVVYLRSARAASLAYETSEDAPLVFVQGSRALVSRVNARRNERTPAPSATEPS